MKKRTLFIIIAITVSLLIVTLFSFNRSLLKKESPFITITAVGDFYLSERYLDKHSYHINKLKLTGDLVFANFEGVLSKSHSFSDTEKMIFTMPYNVVRLIEKIGINSLSLSNNHSLDKGYPDYYDTKKYFLKRKFMIAGLDDRGSVKTIKGKTVRLIGFSFSGKNSVNDILNAQKIIKQFKEDIVIVSAHMGSEGNQAYKIPENKMEYYNLVKRGNVVKFARACLDSGADLVLGHSPHVLRKVELYKGKFITYSSGNFLFDFPGNKRFKKIPSVSLTIFIDKNGFFHKAKVNNYMLDYGIPKKDNTNTGFKYLNKLSGNRNLEFENNLITPKLTSAKKE